jgi:hypothetical protein
MKGKLYFLDNWIVKYQDVWTGDNRSEFYEAQLPLSPDTYFGLLHGYEGVGEEIDFEIDYYFDTQTQHSINVAVLIPTNFIEELNEWDDIYSKYNGMSDLLEFLEWLKINYHPPAKK